MSSKEIETLSDFFREITVLAEGYEFEYKNYILQKVETQSLSPEHSAVKVLNAEGSHVETLNLGAYGSVNSLTTFLEEIRHYDPESLEDWLSR